MASTQGILTDHDNEARGVAAFQEQRWARHYGELEKFRAREGHCNVSRYGSQTKEERSLANWVNHQRKFYKNNGGALPGDRATRLDRIGFVWEPGRAREPRVKEEAASPAAAKTDGTQGMKRRAVAGEGTRPVQETDGTKKRRKAAAEDSGDDDGLQDDCAPSAW